MVEKLLAHIGDFVAYSIPAISGGIVDYLNQINRGDKSWSFFGFLTHLCAAMFFGWYAGNVVYGLGYSAGVVAASGGIGGFLGTRISDLIIFKIMDIDRRS